MSMNPSTGERAADFYAETYDLAVSDWPGEIMFYREMAAQARSKGGGVLEIGCGTGRVAIRLARASRHYTPSPQLARAVDLQYNG